MKKLIISILLIIIVVIASIALIPKSHLKYSEKITYKEYISVPKNNNPVIETKSHFVEDLREQYKNDDIVGRLSIPNTDLNQIILKGPDNDYYLNHNINKEENEDGAVELDYRMDFKDKKIVIYSHNKQDKSLPFSILENYYDINYYNEHKYINIENNEGTIKYLIFSIYVEYQDWDYINTYYNIKNWSSHLKKLKNKSFYDTKVEVSDTDSILILQTCSFDKNYNNYPTKNLLVIAKKVN